MHNFEMFPYFVSVLKYLFYVSPIFKYFPILHQFSSRPAAGWPTWNGNLAESIKFESLSISGRMQLDRSDASPKLDAT